MYHNVLITGGQQTSLHLDGVKYSTPFQPIFMSATLYWLEQFQILDTFLVFQCEITGIFGSLGDLYQHFKLFVMTDLPHGLWCLRAQSFTLKFPFRMFSKTSSKILVLFNKDINSHHSQYFTVKLLLMANFVYILILI